MTTARNAVIAIFLLLLVAPAVQMVTGAVSVKPLDENRNLAAFPTLEALRHPGDYLAKLQAWFNDHYGLRDLLIRTKTQIDYSVFDSSDRLHIGKDGWLYYRTVIDKNEPLNEGLSDKDLDQGIATFTKLRDWLGGRGIHLIVQTEQLKDKFYPEYLPREAQFARTRHRFDDFRVKLAAISGITYIDTTPALLVLKRERRVFHKTDFHWNDPAAYIFAVNLVQTIAKLENRPAPPYRYPLHIIERPFSGGQATFMPLFHPPSEMGLFAEAQWDDSQYPRDYKSKPFEWIGTPVNPDPATNLPATIVFGDSFFDSMVRAGVVWQFDKMGYARLYSVEFADVLRALPPDTKYMVVEFIESELPSWILMELPD